ncbi:uncharacterized mitochondrial protein-like protein [Tanacetum coccineum]
MLLAIEDEAESNLNNKENNFMLDTSYGEETMEELTTAYMLMVRFQPADGNAKTVSSYDAKAISEVNASSKVHEQMHHEKRKTIIQTSDDDQIDSNIIYDDPYVENNSGMSDHDSNDHDEYHKIQMLAYDLAKKAFKERENRYLEDIVDLEEKLSSHDRIVYKMGQSIQTIHMLGKRPNKVYDPFLKARLGYKNLECLKKAIAAQPKMYDCEELHSVNLKINSPDSEETLEDTEESRLKMRNKMVQINYRKLNALYETFVPQQDFSMEQTYFSIPSTSTNSSASKAVTSDLPIPKMSKESKLLKMFDILGMEINGLRTRIDITLLEDRQRRWMSDSKNYLREYYKTDVILKSASLSKNLKELKEELIVEDLLMTISELKDKLRKNEKGKHVNTKFDKSETLGKLVCVTPFNKNLGNKAKNVSNTKVTTDRLKPVTLHSTPKSKKSQKQSANVIARGMYRIKKSETQTPDSKTNIHVSNSTGVESSNSVRRPKSKGTKSKNKVLKNTKSSSAYVRKISCSVSNSKTCVARYALSRNSNVKRALFTTPVAAKYKNLGATFVVAKSRVIQLVLWIVDSGCSKHMTDNLQLLRNFVEKFMGTVCFGNDHFASITGYGYYDRRLSHLNFETINQLSKKASLPPKLVPSTESKLELLHMNLCGPMRVASINGKKYILVIVDDYSRYTWLYFLRTKDEAPDMIIDFVNQVQRNLKAQILMIQTDNGTEFKNKKLRAIYAKLGIVHQTSIARTPQQNGVVERRNLTLVEAARTMLIFYKAPEFLWAEAIATACFTQNCSIVHTRLQEVSDNSAVNTLDNEHTSSSSSIVVEEDEAPQIVSSSAEKVTTEPNFPVLNENTNEFVQEDVANFDGNVFYNAPPTPVFLQHIRIHQICTRLQVHQSPRGIFICQSQYTMDLLKKHGMEKCDTICTPMATTKLDADLQGTQVDQTKYSSMIRGLMYLTASQPDIAFATFYSKEFGFELIAYSDADLAGCNNDCKSTSGGIQFLGDKLVSWSSKKQDCTAMSIAEVEYVSLSACCAQVIWMRTQLLDYGFRYNKITIYCDSQSAIVISCNPLPVETPENLFVEPVNIETIKVFMNKVGYQGVVDKVNAFYTKNLAQPWQTMFKVFNRYLTTRTSGYDQTKINSSNVSCRDQPYKWMLIPDAFLIEEIRANDDFKEYETVFMKVDVPMNQPQLVVSTQGTHRSTPKAHRTPTLTASPRGKKRKQSAGESSSPHKSLKITIRQQKVVEGNKDDDNSENRLEPGSHKDKPEYVDDDNDKGAEKVDEEEGGEMGSLEIRTEETDDDIHSHHDDQEDDAPPEGEKRVKRHKASKSSKSTRGSSSKNSAKDSTTYVSKQQQ